MTVASGLTLSEACTNRFSSSVRLEGREEGKSKTHLANGTPNGQTKVLGAGLLGGDTTEKLGAELERLFAVEGSL